MKTATVGEIQKNFARVLREIKAGEEIIVTNRGEPVARITAIGPKKASTGLMRLPVPWTYRERTRNAKDPGHLTSFTWRWPFLSEPGGFSLLMRDRRNWPQPPVYTLKPSSFPGRFPKATATLFDPLFRRSFSYRQPHLSVPDTLLKAWRNLSLVRGPIWLTFFCCCHSMGSG